MCPQGMLYTECRKAPSSTNPNRIGWRCCNDPAKVDLAGDDAAE